MFENKIKGAFTIAYPTYLCYTNPRFQTVMSILEVPLEYNWFGL